MGTAKKCYKCLTETDENEKTCPRCNARLGARTGSGIAKKPGSPLPALFFAAVLLVLAGKYALKSPPGNSAAPLLEISTGINNARDGAIQKIKEKGAGEFRTVGVADIGYTDDTFCVYVDQRFNDLTRSQQQHLLAIVAGEWKKALGKDSTAVKILEYGTKKTLAELVV